MPKTGATDAKKLYITLQYQPSQFTVDGKTRKTTTDLVSTYTNKFGSSGTPVSEYTYTYDAWDNITNIKDKADRQKTYTYNEYGEITKAVETYPDRKTATYTYTYDNGGNLLTETRDGVRHTYTYDTAWKDKLIKYDGRTIAYDTMGRPTDYMGKAMTWDSSGNLTAIGNTGNGTVRYTYASDGQRRTKTANGKTTTYHYNNGILLSEQTGDETLRYYYDATGKVTTLTYRKGTRAEVSYFFTRNLQGDITAIYRSSDSKLIGTYEYDLWGRPVSVTEATKGIDTDGILIRNPFRYRGYYYDAETGLYHLGARYYDPEIRRFISPDNLIASVGTSVQGHNLYAYCFSNPVNMTDSTGQWPFFAITAAVGAVAGALIGTGVGMAAGVALAGSITASTGAVAAGGSTLCAAVGTGGLGAGASYISGNISKATNQISPAVLKMREVAAKGNAGEAAANIKKNTERIKSITGAAKYRIPDGLDRENKILSEVKNYAGTLAYTAQLKDYVLWAQARGYQVHLYTNAKLTGPLQDVVNRGLIQVFPLIFE